MRKCSQHAECSHCEQEEPHEQNARKKQSARAASTCNTTIKVRGTFCAASIDSHHRDHYGREGLQVPHASIQLFIYVLLFRLTSVHYRDNDLQ